MVDTKTKDKDVIKKLEGLGQQLTAQINKGDNPTIELPVRSLGNIFFDQKSRTIKLGDKVSERQFLNIAHTRKFMQTTLIASEIKKMIAMSQDDIEKYQQQLKDKKLFFKHQQLLEKRDGSIGTKEGEYSAFFIPRLNYFLGKYLRFGGVYPDGVIRLIKKSHAYFPCKDVHEQIVVKGKVGWLENPLLHQDSPTLKRYLQRNNRYIDLIAKQLEDKKIKTDLRTQLDYMLTKPFSWFFMTQIRHKGILDGFAGVVFSFFSALRFPRAYLKYKKMKSQ